MYSYGYSILLSTMGGVAQILGAILFMFLKPEHVFNQLDSSSNSQNLATTESGATNLAMPNMEVHPFGTSNKESEVFSQQAGPAQNSQNLATAQIGASTPAMSITEINSAIANEKEKEASGAMKF